MCLGFKLYPKTVGKTLEDVLNEYLLPRLQSIRKQQPPKVLFARPENGPSSVEMDLELKYQLVLFFGGMFSVGLWRH